MEVVASSKFSTPISRFGIGCEQLGGVDWGDYDVNDGIAAVRAAVDMGVNLFDTANVYGLGVSEERLSAALGSHRHDMCIVTKGGIRWEHDAQGGRAKTQLDLSANNIRSSITDSLRRLRLDVIPLYLVHWPAPDMDLVELVSALAEARESGHIKHFGLSNFSLAQITKACSIAPIDAIETEYNLLETTSACEMFKFCEANDLLTLAYGALGQGLLTGKYDRNSVFPKTDRRYRLKHFNAENLPRNLAIVDRVRTVANDIGKQPSQVAIRYCLDNSTLNSVVVGVKNTKQLNDLVSAADWKLSAEQLRYLDNKD